MGQCEDSIVCGRQDVAAELKDQKVPLLPPGRSNLENTTKLQKLTYRPTVPVCTLEIGRIRVGTLETF